MVTPQIITALRRKVTLSDTIDVAEYARLTEGYSGADLQALVYNAHLDAVHASITEAEANRVREAESSSGSSARLSFTSLGGAKNQTVLSRAEQEVQQRRVETILASLSQNDSRPAMSNTVSSRSNKVHSINQIIRMGLLIFVYHPTRVANSSRAPPSPIT